MHRSPYVLNCDEGQVNFHGEKRSKDTHQSTTDPDAKLARTGQGNRPACATEARYERHHAWVRHVAAQRGTWICIRPRETNENARSHHEEPSFVAGVRLLASWLQLACGDSCGAGRQSTGAGDRRQAAISLDTEATDGSVPAVAHVNEAAVVAQSHVGWSASSAR